MFVMLRGEGRVANPPECDCNAVRRYALTK
jgi:hypothetical protein